MVKIPEICKHGGILTNWKGYPAGSVERAKALGIEVATTFSRLDATTELWERVCERIEQEKAWEPLGLVSKDAYIEAITGRSDKFIRGKIKKVEAIRQRRQEFPDETQQATADAVGCSRVLVTRVVTKTSESEEKVTIPDWVTHQDLRAAFRKLPREEQERLAALPPGERRGAVRRAAIAAGIIKETTGLDRLRKAWAKATEDERGQFIREVQHGG